MKRTISIDGLSKHREIFMGIAVVCVMLCHNTLLVPQQLIDLRQIVSLILQCGVDVFMLLSGLGLYFSFRKNSKVGYFWKKRYTKVLPPYIVVVLIYGIVSVCLLRKTTVVQYIWKYSLISFFVEGKMALWFIASILMLYAVFPLLYRLLQRFPNVFVGTIIVVIAGSIGVSFLACPEAIARINGVFVCRIPAFLVGMIIAKTIWNDKCKKIAVVYVWLVWLASAALIIQMPRIMRTNYLVSMRLLFLPFVLSGMLLLIAPIEKCKVKGVVYKSFAFLGGLTLEIYLLHERVLEITDMFWIEWVNINISHVVLAFGSNVLAVLIAVGGAWILQKGVASFPKSLEKIKN